MKLSCLTAKALTVFPGLALIIMFTACEKKSISFAQDFAESYTHVVLIDTLTPALSTYKLDSFPTSGTGTVLIGAYTDSIFGKISAVSYFQVSPPSVQPEIALDAVYDSITLVMKPNKNFYGDTTKPLRLEVHELASKLQFPGSTTSFYNTSSIPYQSLALGMKSLIVQPNKTDSIEIRLADNKGQDFFSKLQAKTTDITDAATFQDYFKGLAIVPGSNNQAIYNVGASDSTMKVRLYYRDKGVVLQNRFVDFPFANSTVQFNQLLVDRSATVLKNLPAKNPLISSGLEANAAYIQSATGLTAKINFPSLHQLLNLHQNGKILKAELIIKPVANTYNDLYQLPPQLTLVSTDQYNTIGAALTSSTGTAQTGNLFIDRIYGDQTNYSFDITSFLQKELQTDIEGENGLFIYPPSPAFQSSFNRLVIGDNKNEKGKMQINIYYLTVD